MHFIVIALIQVKLLHPGQRKKGRQERVKNDLRGNMPLERLKKNFNLKLRKKLSFYCFLFDNNQSSVQKLWSKM